MLTAVLLIIVAMRESPLIVNSLDDVCSLVDQGQRVGIPRVDRIFAIAGEWLIKLERSMRFAVSLLVFSMSTSLGVPSYF